MPPGCSATPVRSSTAPHPSPTKGRSMSGEPTGCPFHAAVLPTDGTPLAPSPTIEQWRREAPATPLDYDDGHRGLVATRYDLVRTVLEDPRFSMRPARMPLHSTAEVDDLDIDETRRPYPSTTPDGHDVHVR